MRKAFIPFLAVCLVAGFAACKKNGEDPAAPTDVPSAVDYRVLGKYAEVGPVMEKMIQANENYVDALEKAETAEEVAAAIDAMTDAMIELGPAIQAINEKFPEFKTQEEPPAELKPLNDRLVAAMMGMLGVLSKLDEFESDPLVEAAQERYNKAMEGIED